ncbi:MAG: phosphomannomutase/phosphoglucomutase [Anaerovoracaceae bacterium]
MEADYRKLQNGSDIRGIAMEGVEGEAPNLGEEVTRRLSKGFLIWLSKKSGKKAEDLKISLGRDPRLSGEDLLRTAKNAIGEEGAEVIDCGLASTPAMFMSTVFPEFLCDGAIMITASHLPFNRNGFKYFDKDGGLNKEDISHIITLAQSMDSNNTSKPPAHSNYARKPYPNLMDIYSAHLRNLIKEAVSADDYDYPLSGMKITVDAGNGGGGFYATKVLAPLGADISSSQYLDPDGSFPNHPPNPENKEAMASISKAVVSSASDFGLIFDTDVDRSGAVDRYGREIARNGIVALAAALIADEHPGTTIVTDSVTSDQLNTFLEKRLGLKHLRFKRGYRNVINESIRLNKEGIDSQLAIETSGHGAFKENFFLDDGAYLATKIVIRAALLQKAGATLDSLIDGLEEPMESIELRFPIKCSDFSSYGDRILKDLADFVSGKSKGANPSHIKLVEPNFEGVRISFDKINGDGWCLLRKSLHDPLMPLNVESNQGGGCKIICMFLSNFLEKYDNLDISALKKYMES